MTRQAVDSIRGLRAATDGPVLTPSDPGFAALPAARRVLAVIARPGQESEELGGLLYAFGRVGASLSLLCLTRGEASPLNSARARLEAIRPWELQLAAVVLGIGELTVASYPDGGLHRQPAAELASRIHRAIRQHRAGLLLIIGPEAGGRDESAVAFAARAAAARAGVPVMARTRPGVRGARLVDLGTDAATARAIQKAAARAHASQSEALPAVVRRLDLRDGREPLRWLRVPRPAKARRPRSGPRGQRRAGQLIPAGRQVARLDEDTPSLGSPAPVPRGEPEIMLLWSGKPPLTSLGTRRRVTTTGTGGVSRNSGRPGAGQ